MKTDLYNTKGEKTGTINLPDVIFKTKVNKKLMTQAVRVYLSNQRHSPAKAKTRGEVNYSTRKIYKQKGTGRARHGDRKAPIFVHGGKAHGPTGTQNYHLKLNKNMRKLALFSALTSKLKDKELIVISGMEKIEAKTKNMAKIILTIKNKISLQVRSGQANLKKANKKLKMTILFPSSVENIIRAGRNIEGLNLLQANSLNTYEILNGGLILLMDSSIDVLQKVYLKDKNI